MKCICIQGTQAIYPIDYYIDNQEKRQNSNNLSRYLSDNLKKINRNHYKLHVNSVKSCAAMCKSLRAQ